MIKNLVPKYVETMPEKMELGVLYISEKYCLAIHLCACGNCGWETVTPIDDGKLGWKMIKENDKITLTPSIGAFQHPCKSHYSIKQNEIVWHV
jgi:hypothetical protein